MKTLFAIAALLLLAACAQYAPQVLGQPDDPLRYTQDVAWCHGAAQAYKPDSRVGAIVQGGVTGGFGSLSYAPINPLIPLLGAAGGAASAATGNGQARRNVEKHCLQEKTRRDGSALVADPDQ